MMFSAVLRVLVPTKVGTGA